MKRTNTNRLTRLLTLTAVFVLLALCVSGFCGSSTLQDLVFASAQADETNVGGGSKIESIEIHWRDSDDPKDLRGNPVDGDLADDAHLFRAVSDNANVTMSYQLEVSFSGQFDYEPESIRIYIPAKIWPGRMYVENVDGDGECSVVGVADPNKYVDSLSLPVPQYPASAGAFAWQLDTVNNQYVLTNTKTQGATSKAMFQFTISVPPTQVVDMSISDKLVARCEVDTEEGVITLTSNELTAQIDTKQQLRSTTKNGKMYLDAGAVPAKLLANLPGGAESADEYIYVRWESYVYHAGNQPFTLWMEDKLSNAYYTDSNGLKQYATDGIFLGCTLTGGEIKERGVTDGRVNDTEVAFTREMIVTPQYDVSSGDDHQIIMWSAYKKADMPAAEFTAGERSVKYEMSNDVHWFLLESDGTVTAADIKNGKKQDDRELTDAQANARVVYSPTSWKYPPGHFYTNKWTEEVPNKDWLYGYGLNALQLGNSVEMHFILESRGFGLPWTTKDVVETVDELGQIPKEDYGWRGWRQVTEDFRTEFNYSNEELTSRDFEITKLRIGIPTTYRYDIMKEGGYAYLEGHVITAGYAEAGTWAYQVDSTLPIPDMRVEYRLNGEDTWYYAGTARWAGGARGAGAIVDVNTAEGVSADGLTFTFPENTTDFRYIFTTNVIDGQAQDHTDIAAVFWRVYPTIILKPSAENIAIADELFAAFDEPSTEFINYDRMWVDGWVKPEDACTIFEGDCKYHDNLNPDGFEVDVRDPNDIAIHPNQTIVECDDTCVHLGWINDDASMAHFAGAVYGVRLSKSGRFDPMVDNDVALNRAIIHYDATLIEQSNLTSRADYDAAVAEGIIPKEDAGMWYDLLPPGVYPLVDTIKLGGKDTMSGRPQIISNYKSSGRVLLKVPVTMEPALTTMEPALTTSGRYWSDKHTISFDAFYSWDDYASLGKRLVNYVAFESQTESLFRGLLGTKNKLKGHPDTPTGGYNMYTPTFPEDITGYLTGLNPNSVEGERRFVYAQAVNELNLNVYAVSSMSKKVQDDLQPGWTQGLEEQTQVTVYEGHPYSYRLHVKSHESTSTANIVIYDTLENYVVPNPAGTESELPDQSKAYDYNHTQERLGWQGDWEGKGQWRGELKSIDLSQLMEQGIAPVLYYATTDNAADHVLFPDTESGLTIGQMSHEQRLEFFSKGAYRIEGNTLWHKAELGADGIWVVPELGEGISVDAIAIDARLMTDGTPFVLEPEKEIYAYLHMVAPDDNGDPEVWHAKGAYAHVLDADGNPTKEVDWDAAMDKQNNMYAYNNVRLVCTQGRSGAEALGISSPMLIRKDFTRVGILPRIIDVKKVWNDNDDYDAVRPDEIVVRLMRKVSGTKAAPEYVLGVDGKPLTLTLNEANEWKGKFYQIDVVDEENTPYEYSFEEGVIDDNGDFAPVPEYESKVVYQGETNYELVNTHKLFTVKLDGHKEWQADEDGALVLPESITVTLLRNGQTFAPESKHTKVIKPDADGNWTWRFGYDEDLLKNARGGVPYVYAVKEEVVEDFVLEETDLATYELLENRYIPWGDLEIEKKLLNATATAQANNSFTFTVKLYEKDSVNEDGETVPGGPLDGEYEYKIYELVDDEWVEIPANGEQTLTSGQQITLKGGQKAVVFRLPSGAAYEITENETEPCFTLESSEGETGKIKWGDTVHAEFVNRYEANGATQFPVHKTLTGHAMNTPFYFSAVDKTEGSATYGKQVASAHVGSGEDKNPDREPGDDILFENDAIFSAITYTQADDGKTFTYEVVEKAINKPGYSQAENSTKVFTVEVTVKDNGDGTLTICAIDKATGKSIAVDENGNSETRADFANEYKATGELVLKGWKTLQNKDPGDNVFTFDLYKYDPATKSKVGDPLQTVESAPDGSISFNPIMFTEKDVTLDKEHPAEYWFMVSERKGDDPKIVYTDKEYVIKVTALDNGKGTIGFNLNNKSAERAPCAACSGAGKVDGDECAACRGTGMTDAYTFEDAAVVLFENEYEDGSLKVKKTVAEGNPGGEFTFHVKLRGENLPGAFDYDNEPVVMTATPSPAPTPTPTPSPEPTEVPTPKPPCEPFHVDPAVIKDTVPFIFYNETTDALTFYRVNPDDPKDLNGHSFTMVSADDSKVQCAECGGYSMNIADVETDVYRQISHYIPRSTVVSVEMKDPLYPTAQGALQSLFYDASNLKTADLSKMDTSNVESLVSTFNRCSNLTSLDLSKWDTSKVTSLNGTFRNCSNLTSIGDVSEWDTSNVETLLNTFNGCSNLTSLDLSNWDTSNVETLENTFEACINLTSIGDVSGWNTSKVTTLKETFYRCNKLTSLDLSNWNTSKVTSLWCTFSGCSNLTSLDLSNWDTSNVKNMYSTFSNCSNLTSIGDVSKWKTSNVKSLQDTFCGCEKLTSLDMSGWDTSSVSTIHTMFLNTCFDYITIGYPIFEKVGGNNNLHYLMSKAPDNRWTNRDREKKELLTSRELLLSGNDHSGTWYSFDYLCDITFKSEGGDGAMADLTDVDTTKPNPITPGYTKRGYVLLGFEDDWGNLFPIGIDGKVTIPAMDQYSAGDYLISTEFGHYFNYETVTLYAVWAAASGSTTLTNGEMTFTLRNNESRTFKHLPAGTAYEVWEDTPNGWVLIQKVNEAGEIAPLETSTAEFTNDYRPGEARVDLRAAKLLDGEPAADGVFTFTLTGEGQNQRVTNKTGGVVSFDQIIYNKDTLNGESKKEFTYTIAECKGTDATIEYDINTYTVTVTVEDDGEGNISATTVYNTTDEKPPVFENTTKPGSLKIAKKITGALSDEAKAAEFTIEVSFTDAQHQPFVAFPDGRIQLSNGGVLTVDENGTGKLTLKGGDSVVLMDIPAGVTFTVTETGELPGWTMDEREITGTIEPDMQAEASFENSYAAKGVASVQVIKVLVGRVPEDGEFTFGLFDGSTQIGTATNRMTTEVIEKRLPDSSETVTETVEYSVAKFDPITFNEPVADKTYTIREIKGNDATVNYSDEIITVKITMVDNGNGTLTAVNTSEIIADADYTSSNSEQNSKAFKNTITNTLKPGSLNITKKVVDGTEATAEQKFTFTLTLTDADGKAVNGTFPIQIGTANTQLTVTDGEATFELKADESARITELPHGTKFTVEEAPVTGYTTEQDADSEQITAGQDSQVTQTNTYAPKGEYTIQVEKTLLDDEDVEEEITAGQFLFRLVNSDGDTVETVSCDAEGKAAFATMTFDASDVGATYSYRVQEVDNKEAGITYDTTVYEVTLTVTDNGSGELQIEADGVPDEGVLSFVNHKNEKTKVKATKVWKDDEEYPENRTEITLDLYKSVMAGDHRLVDTKVIPEDAEGEELTVEWDNLPVFEMVGSRKMPVTYTVEEREVGDNYESTTEVTEANSYMIVNRLVYAEVVLTAAKTVDGEEPTADQKYKFVLRDEAGEELETVENDGSWIEFSAIAYNKNDMGKTFIYTIEEEEVDYVTTDATIYTVKVTPIDLKPGVEVKVEITKDGEEAPLETIAFNNELKWTEIEGTKTWVDDEDAEGKRPTQIVVKLLANGEVVHKKIVTEADNWSWTFTDLAMYDGETKIEYTIEEEPVAGYETTVDGYDVVNALVTPKPTPKPTVTPKPNTTTVKVRKVWRGVEGTKPAITLKLYANGEVYEIKQPKVTKDGWYIYKNLPKEINGERVEYYVLEEPMNGYHTMYTAPDGSAADAAYNGYTITNATIPKTGDNSHLEVWTLMAAGSLMGLMLLAARRKLRG